MVIYDPGSEKKCAVSVKTVHKEYGTISPKECWWNWQKADAQFSALRAHRPEVSSKAKEVENYQYTFALTRQRLRLFFALLISSVFTEQSQICVKNAKTAM